MPSPIINNYNNRIVLSIIYSFVIGIFASLFIKYISGDIKKYILLYEIEENIKSNLKKNKINKKSKRKIGLLTNEIPPIVYGGVATWISNFLNMFDNDEDYEVIPIFLAVKDKPCKKIFWL